MVAVVDAMAVVQTCSDLAKHSEFVVFTKFSVYAAVHLVFDRHDMPSYFKINTRILQQGNEMLYHIISRTIHH